MTRSKQRSYQKLDNPKWRLPVWMAIVLRVLLFPARLLVTVWLWMYYEY